MYQRALVRFWEVKICFLLKDLYLRNLVMNLVGNESLRVKLLQEVEKTICKHLDFWCGQASVELKEAVAEMLRALLLVDS
ncbi:hypothetical protein NC652_013157 [Populus alba x Populus x berolinensis]|nr:hypothetical protein NC652_013157 [Populus alba x Populus x berolinensis]